jgi:hypothetical protein
VTRPQQSVRAHKDNACQSLSRDQSEGLLRLATELWALEAARLLTGRLIRAERKEGSTAS